MRSLIIGAITLFTLLTIGCSKTETQTAKENGNTTDFGPAPTTSTVCPWGDDDDPQPMLHGRVKDASTMDDLLGVCVNLKTSGNVFVDVIGTDSSGHYYFNEVSSGSYNLVFSKTGYYTKTIPIVVDTIPQEVSTQLNPIPSIP